MVRFIDTFFQVALGLTFVVGIAHWLLYFLFGFDLVGWLHWPTFHSPADD